MCIDLAALAIKSGRRSLNGRPADLHDDDFRLTLRTAFGVFSTYVALYRRYPRSGSRSYLPTRAAPLALAHKSYLPTPGSLGEGGNPADSALRTRNGSQGFKKEEKKKRGDKEKRETKSAAPGPSRVVPHRSTTPAQTCLTSLFGWEAVSQADMAALRNSEHTSIVNQTLKH